MFQSRIFSKQNKFHKVCFKEYNDFSFKSLKLLVTLFETAAFCWTTAPCIITFFRLYCTVLRTSQLTSTYVMFSVLKLVTMLLMKFSRITTALIAFQSDTFSPNSRQMDSSAILTTAGGLAIDLTSTSCCFLISFTATYNNDMYRIRHAGLQVQCRGRREQEFSGKH